MIDKNIKAYDKHKNAELQDELIERKISFEEKATKEEMVALLEADDLKQEGGTSNTDPKTLGAARAVILSTNHASTSHTSVKGDNPVTDLNPGLPRIKIAYPKDFKGQRFFKDGDIVAVSQETADQLVELDIATIVK